MVGGDEAPTWGVIGKVNCATWIRRRGGGANRLLVLYGRGGTATSPLILDLFAFTVRACALASEPLLRLAMVEDEDDTPRAIAVHPGSDKFVWATAKGCRAISPLENFGRYGEQQKEKKKNILSSYNPR